MKGGNVAPGLQAAKEQLEKEQKANELDKKISHRPDKETLVEKHILDS